MFWVVVAALSCCSLVQARPLLVKSVAGTESLIFGGDGGPASSASLSSPNGLWLDSNGDLFIADTKYNRARKIDSQTNKISTIAGSAAFGLSGDGGPATLAALFYPQGVWASSTGQVFIADAYNHRIRTISPSTGIISTFAGSFTRGLSGNTDNVPGTSAKMYGSNGMVVDSAGHVYVSEYNYHKIRKASASTGIVSMLAGTGLPGFSGDGGPAILSKINLPYGLGVDTDSNVYFCDSANYRMRKVLASTQTIATIAGSGSSSFADGPASSAGISSGCRGVWVDSIGNVFFVDNGHNRLRKIDTQLGIVSTIAGTGVFGQPSNNALATSSGIGTCFVLTGDSLGNIYFNDDSTFRIHKVSSSSGILTFAVGSGKSGYNTNVVATSAMLGTIRALFLDNYGNLYMGDHAVFRLRMINVFDPQSTISDVIGTGVSNLAPDDTPFSSASIGMINAIWKDSSGTIFLVDNSNNRVRKLDPLTGTISTVLGSGETGFAGNTGNGGPATSALLSGPLSVIGDSIGIIFISDTTNNAIRKVGNNGTIIAFAGTMMFSFSGDGGPASSATLKKPQGLWLTSDRTLFFAETENHRIRKISSSGIISTVIGNGMAALSGDGGPSLSTSVSLSIPNAVFLGTDNAMYVADSGNHRIRFIDSLSGIISTIAGQGSVGLASSGADNVPGTSAYLNSPRGIVWDLTGNLLVVDSSNNRLRKVLSSTNIISAFAGSFSSGFTDNVVPTSARFSNPSGIFADTNGNIFIADTSNFRVRMINASTGLVSTIAGTGIFSFNGDGLPGTSTNINSPYSLWRDTLGVTFIGENARIRRMDTNKIATTIVGTGTLGSSSDGIPGTSAKIGNVYHIFGDSEGTIYFTDSSTHKIRIFISSNGTLGTFAGSGSAGYSLTHEDISATSASLNNPSGFWFDSQGNCFIADSGNHRIRKVSAGSD